MNKTKKNNIPIKNFKIQKVEPYDNYSKKIEDIRFTRVKITLMHTGENLNYSIFPKKSVEQAIPTLANTPILGYIKYNEDGSKDFKEHEWEIKINNNSIEEKYIGSAYGVIPEDNNAHFEEIEDEYGVKREYLIVDGIIWNRFDDVISILNRDLYKYQSMEISDNYTGYWNDKGYYVFENFEFNGACFLGDEYLPAMEGANITKFNLNKNNNISQYIKNNLKKYMAQQNDYKNKGGKTMPNNDENKNNELLLIEYANKIAKLEEELKKYSNKENDEKINDLSTKVEQYSKDIEEKDNEIKELSNKIEETELEEKKSIIEEYSEKLLGVEEYENLKKDIEEIKKYSVQETKNTLNRIFGENVFNGNISTKFNKEQENNQANIYFSKNKSENINGRYGDLF